MHQSSTTTRKESLCIEEDENYRSVLLSYGVDADMYWFLKTRQRILPGGCTSQLGLV